MGYRRLTASEAYAEWAATAAREADGADPRSTASALLHLPAAETSSSFERRLEEARQTRNAARGKIDETEKLIKFCQDQHLSSWRDWASARHKRHDFFTGRATAKVESLRKGMAKSRATIPDAVWERMKRDEQQRYDAELRAAQDLNVSEDSPAAPRSTWQRLLQLGR